MRTPPGWPQTVLVPRLSVLARIEPVNMMHPADSEAPHRMDDVAWYSRGHRPGERGRAELFGHLDSTCCPAIFYQLRTMKPGDLVQVRYKTGKPLTFRVRWQATYSRTRLPLSFMYGPTTDHGLMLVTCSGLFHRDGTGYDHRLIVYATLIP
jgi:sortase (surface protein transpeptidase)